MYEERFIAFVDILGFGKLVDESAVDPDLPKKILSALLSIHPTKIKDELIVTVNEEMIAPEELDSVREVARTAAAALNIHSPVDVNYFSDSLVISAKADDMMAAQMVLDLLTKLSAMMWMSHKLLLRGGVTCGKLIHIENGPMFGPAMNRAYHLESKEAKVPRFLIDHQCIEKYRAAFTFELFESFIEKDGDYYYGSLPTSFRHILNDSSLVLAGEKVLRKYRESMLSAPSEIQRLRERFKDNDNVRSKYEWLAEEFRLRILEVNPPFPSEDDE